MTSSPAPALRSIAAQRRRRVGRLAAVVVLGAPFLAAPALAFAEAPPEARPGASAERATAGGGQPFGDTSQPQPTSRADANGGGANASGPYDSTRDGSTSDNGRGDGEAAGRPCAGCVGAADNKNPQGQLPGPDADGNRGFECDENSGIGRSNPAHTGCTSATGAAEAEASASPSPAATPASPSPSPTAETTPTSAPVGGGGDAGATASPSPSETATASPSETATASPSPTESATESPSEATSSPLPSDAPAPITGTTDDAATGEDVAPVAPSAPQTSATPEETPAVDSGVGSGTATEDVPATTPVAGTDAEPATAPAPAEQPRVLPFAAPGTQPQPVVRVQARAASQLPRTGADAGAVALLGGLMLAVGGLFMVASRPVGAHARRS